MNRTKEIKPSYIVDLDEIETLSDIAVTFALAKHNAGLPLTDEDLTDIIEYAVKYARPLVFICECKCEKKTPWYKRLWNKLKYAFTW